MVRSLGAEMTRVERGGRKPVVTDRLLYAGQVTSIENNNNDNNDSNNNHTKI